MFSSTSSSEIHLDLALLDRELVAQMFSWQKDDETLCVLCADDDSEEESGSDVYCSETSSDDSQSEEESAVIVPVRRTCRTGGGKARQLDVQRKKTKSLSAKINGSNEIIHQLSQNLLQSVGYM